MVVGVVGKTCSGKNYVCNLLEKRGYHMIDLDVIGHEALKDCRLEIIKTFGQDIVDSEGNIDRKILGDLVFSSKNKLKKLENISFPYIRLKVEEELDRFDLCAVNGAVIQRGGFDKYCQYILFVESSVETRWQRSKKRDKISREAFMKRDAAQKDVVSNSSCYSCPVIVIENDIDSEIIRQVYSFCDKIENR